MVRPYLHAVLCIPLLLLSFKTYSQQKYKNPALPIQARIDDLLSQMTLEEKVNQVTGKGFDTRPNDRLGIPSLLLADGPLGVRSGKSTAFPSGVSMGASWDTTLIWNVGQALGEETKAKGLNCLLGPCVNIHRSAFGGRNFESFSEDPYLSSRLAVAYVKGLQSTGVSSSVKHFAGNEYEWERNIANTVANKRTMEEIYYPPFKAAIKEADAWTVMCAYNKFNGVYCGENDQLLNKVLKSDWGFKVLVVSDWGATHSTKNAAESGLDLEMPDGQFFGKTLLAAIKNGTVTEEKLNEMVRRNLYVLYKTGLMDRPMVKDTSKINSATHQAIALDGARKSIVMLKNDDNILPLRNDKIKKIAAIGPAAAIALVGGGGSSQVTPFSANTPYEMIKKRAGKNIQVQYKMSDTNALDKYLFTETSKKVRGLKGEYFNNIKLEGKPDVIRIDRNINFDFGTDPPHKEISANRFSVRWTGKMLAPATRDYRFDLVCDDGARLYIDNKPIIDDWNNGAPRLKSGTIKLEANKLYDIKVEYYDNELGAICQIGWDYIEGEQLDPGNMEDAISLAKGSDVALVFVGYSSKHEREAYDKPLDLLLPNDQNKLIEAIANVNPNTVVVIYSGTPIIMNSWINKVKGVLCAWYP
ncbi:MAG TPA: glycoside hydrolase family 3 N-terminal domain-containing protein, partial [Cytophagaceae bacterium]